MILRYTGLVFLTLFLASCFMGRLPPPSGQLAELTLDASDNTAAGNLRLVNMGDKPMALASAQLVIHVGEFDVFSGSLALNLTLYGKATETVPFRSRLPSGDIAAIVAAKSLPYTIKGSILLEDDTQSQLGVDSHGILTPTPGLPGRFR